jgi:hypothetical protein
VISGRKWTQQISYTTHFIIFIFFHKFVVRLWH